MAVSGKFLFFGNICSIAGESIEKNEKVFKQLENTDMKEQGTF